LNITPRRLVVVGGGPVGLSVAALLGSYSMSENFEIRLLDSGNAPIWLRDNLDLRVYALSRISQNILKHLGVWESIMACRTSPYERMHVWQGDHDDRLGSLTFDSAEVGEPDLGHIVEDSLLRAELTKNLESTDVEITFGAELSAIDIRQGEAHVTLATGEILSADVLVAADGGSSTVRDLLKMPVTKVSYEQQAIVTHIETEYPHAETAWQRFLPGGPLAFLPLADGRSSVVWSVNSDQAETLCELEDAEFRSKLQNASGGVLGEIFSLAKRARFPLQASHAHQYCRDRVVLVGDAAHTIHPLAGQGMNLGLMDAAVVTDVLFGAIHKGENPGDLRVLRRYERQRKGDNLKMLLALDVLHRLFGVSGAIMPSLRAIGLSAFDAMPFAKSMIMQRALGYRSQLPEAAIPPIV
jgi:2-polyprenylphenol 6-hydroxylase